MANHSNPWTNHGMISTPGIPAPTGPYHVVGCADVMTDSGLLVRLYYPSHCSCAQDGYQYAEARPHPNYTRAIYDLFGFEPVHWMTLVTLLTDCRIPALLHAPLLPPSGPLPVIVFSHGLHGYRTIYSGICCDLASHGYLVACVEHKDRSACVTFTRKPPPGVAEGDYDNYRNEWIYAIREQLNDFPLRNKQLNQRRSEVSAALDILISLNNGHRVNNLMGGAFDLTQFTGRLDTVNVAVMGHSFGGATTVQSLVMDKRFKCGLAMDTWMYPISDEVYTTHDGLTQPLLFINSSRFQWEENLDCMRRLVTPPDKQTGISRVSMVTLKHTTHYNQTDVGFTLPPSINSLVRKTDVYQTHATNCQLLQAFLKRHLVKEVSYQGCVPLLDGGEGCSEYVTYDSIDQENSRLPSKL